MTTIRPCRLNAQPFAPFGPATLDHLFPLPGGHPFQKTMGSGPFQFAGLIRSFHAIPLLMIVFDKKV
jgi:hypothetical protein